MLSDAEFLIHLSLQAEIENLRRRHRPAQLEYFGVGAEKVIELFVVREAVNAGPARRNAPERRDDRLLNSSPALQRCHAGFPKVSPARARRKR